LKVEGSHLFKSSQKTVWACMTNPQIISRCIPGCENMELDGEDSYNVTLKIGIGAIKGVFTGRICLKDKQPVSQYRMRVEGKGGPGFLTGEGLICLKESGTDTEVSYSGDVQIGGLIASVGQRMLQGFAKQNISQFFSALAKETEAFSSIRATQKDILQ
jgi:carbon monoxide dehydrogenase subunit G